MCHVIPKFFFARQNHNSHLTSVVVFRLLGFSWRCYSIVLVTSRLVPHSQTLPLNPSNVNQTQRHRVRVGHPQCHHLIAELSTSGPPREKRRLRRKLATRYRRTRTSHLLICTLDPMRHSRYHSLTTHSSDFGTSTNSPLLVQKSYSLFRHPG